MSLLCGSVPSALHWEDAKGKTAKILRCAKSGLSPPHHSRRSPDPLGKKHPLCSPKISAQGRNSGVRFGLQGKYPGSYPATFAALVKLPRAAVGAQRCPSGHPAPGRHEAQPRWRFASRQSVKWAEPPPGTVPRAGAAAAPGKQVWVGPHRLLTAATAAATMLLPGSSWRTVWCPAVLPASPKSTWVLHRGPCPTAGLTGWAGPTDTESPGSFGMFLACVFCAQGLDAHGLGPVHVCPHRLGDATREVIAPAVDI